MSHTLADDAEGYVHISGDARPRMSGDIHGDGQSQACHCADALQSAIDIRLHTLVLHVFRFIRILDDGQHIGGVLGLSRVSVNYLLQFQLPCYGDLLVGLLAAVAQQSVLQVYFLQTGNVYPSSG